MFYQITNISKSRWVVKGQTLIFSFFAGMDVYNSKKEKKIDKDLVIKDVDFLEDLKTEGFETIPINNKLGGGIWDANGKPQMADKADAASGGLSEIDKRIKDIGEIKREAVAKFETAKQNIKNDICYLYDIPLSIRSSQPQGFSPALPPILKHF